MDMPDTCCRSAHPMPPRAQLEAPRLLQRHACTRNTSRPFARCERETIKRGSYVRADIYQGALAHFTGHAPQETWRTRGRARRGQTGQGEPKLRYNKAAASLARCVSARARGRRSTEIRTVPT